MSECRIRVDDRVACLDGCPIDVPRGAVGIVLLAASDDNLFIRWPEIGVQAWTTEQAEEWLRVVERST